MKKTVTLIAALALISTPAFGQVRPQDCRPLLPLLDDVPVASLQPADVIAEPALPAAAASRGFFGLPFLLPLLALAGGAAALAGLGGNGSTQVPVSPA